MADKYTPERATSGKEWLRTWRKKVENNFTKIFGAVNKHIDGTADRHTADMIDYSDTETVRAKLDSTDTKLDSTDTKLDTKVDKVSGKSLIDSDVASSLHKQAGGIVYNASKDAFTVGDVSDGGSVMSDMNGNVTYTFGSYAKITSYDVEVKKARHLAHRLSEKANSSDVFLKSDDVVLAKDKIIKVIKDGESTVHDGSTENIQIRGDAMFIRANDVEPYGLMLSKDGIVLDTDDNENVNIKSGEITVYKKDSTGNSVAHKLTEKANTSDVLEKTNTTEFTPTADYQPATKKYVDDAIKAAIEKYNTEAMALLGED